MIGLVLEIHYQEMFPILGFPLPADIQDLDGLVLKEKLNRYQRSIPLELGGYFNLFHRLSKIGIKNPMQFGQLLFYFQSDFPRRYAGVS